MERTWLVRIGDRRARCTVKIGDGLGRLAFPEDPSEQRQAGAARRVALANEVRLEFDHQGLEIDQVTNGFDRQRHATGSVRAKLLPQQRAHGLPLSIDALSNDVNLRDAAAGAEPTGVILKTLLLLLELVNLGSQTAGFHATEFDGRQCCRGDHERTGN